MLEFNVQKFRTSKKLKQSEFGEILGIKQSYVSDIESGRKKITQDILNKLTEKFGDISEYYEDQTENEISTLKSALEIINKQIDSIKTKDEQINRLITLLENQLNNRK